MTSFSVIFVTMFETVRLFVVGNFTMVAYNILSRLKRYKKYKKIG